MKKIVGLIIVVCLAIAITPRAYTIFKARNDFKMAEVRVEEAIAAGRTVIDFKGLKSLSQIPARVRDIEGLWYFSAAGTKVADVSVLSDLPDLKSVYLADTRVADLSPLRSNGLLEQLDIGRTWVFDLQPLMDLPRLRWLQMDRIAVKSICPLQKVHGLNWINFYQSYANDGSQECFRKLEQRVKEVGGGNSYRQNYIPGAPYKLTVWFDQFLKYWEWR